MHQAKRSGKLVEASLARARHESKVFQDLGVQLRSLTKYCETEADLEASDGHVRKKTKRQLQLYFDGASKRNPGEAGCGWALTDEEGVSLVYGWKYLGDHSTNNEAEYVGAIQGMQAVLASPQLKTSKIRMCGDSKLVVHQVQGEWQCKAPTLLPLYKQAQSLFRKISDASSGCSLEYIPRNENMVADCLANLAVHRKDEKVVEESVALDVAYLKSAY